MDGLIVVGFLAAMLIILYGVARLIDLFVFLSDKAYDRKAQKLRDEAEAKEYARYSQLHQVATRMLAYMVEAGDSFPVHRSYDEKLNFVAQKEQENGEALLSEGVFREAFNAAYDGFLHEEKKARRAERAAARAHESYFTYSSSDYDDAYGYSYGSDISDHTYRILNFAH